MELNYVQLSNAISQNNISIVQLSQEIAEYMITQATQLSQLKLLLNNSVNELNNSLYNQYVKQTYIIQQLNVVDANLNAYQSTVNSVNNIQNQSISTLQGQVSSLINQVASLQNQIGSANSQIYSQQLQINSLSSQLGSIQAGTVVLTTGADCDGQYYLVCNTAHTICFGARSASINGSCN
ncbi:Hypothetical_protein [Hexamita inflata]|uniref:Hypothetical_protein n=1 Tax=Hexamita inflata TaxID=28002 RepID=A0AA86TKQ1_9EUKA|nr:Hypothetical protein HINF_LOCUS3483 [Hexamita inflata]